MAAANPPTPSTRKPEGVLTGMLFISVVVEWIWKGAERKRGEPGYSSRAWLRATYNVP
jgi:hypothetical protein